MPRHLVRRLAMRGLGWMVAVSGVALVFSAAHILGMPLVFQTTLLLKPSGLGRGPPIRVPRWRGRTAVPVVLHTGSGVFRGLLLIRLALLIRPVAHPLWRCRWGATVMVPVHLRRHPHLRRVSHASFRPAVARVFMMRRVVRLMLGIRRLGGWHAALMHADVVPRAVGAVQHRIRLRRTAIDTRWRWWHSRRRPSVVGIRHAFARLRSRRTLRRRGLLLHRRTAEVRRRRRRPTAEWLRSVGLSKGPHLLLLPRARLPRDRRGLPAKRITVRSSIGVWRLGRRVYVVDPSPSSRTWHGAGGRTVWRLRLLRCRASPLRARRSDSALVLVCLRVHVGRHGRLRYLAVCTTVTQQLQPCLDMRVGWVQFSSPLIRIQGIADLVVAGLVLYGRG